MSTKPLILIAEDDPDDQYFFQEAIEVLTPLEAETQFMLDGAKLLNFLRGMDPAELKRRIVIVLDLNMQVKSGLSTLNEIKADPAFAHIPVVILTTSSGEVDEESSLQHGAAAYYRKPDSIVELVNTVQSIFRDHLA